MAILQRVGYKQEKLELHIMPLLSHLAYSPAQHNRKTVLEADMFFFVVYVSSHYLFTFAQLALGQKIIS
jgi:hypothetical protein